MKIATSVKSLTILSGVLGVMGLGLLAPSASARPSRTTRRTTTTRTTTVTRSRPVVTTRSRPVVVTRSRPVVNTRTRTTTTVRRNRPVIIRTPRTVVRNNNYNRNRYTNQSSTWAGSVTYVSGGRFGINIGGRVYNVLASVGLPRGLSRGDVVQIAGVRTNSTIRANRVYITRNV